MRLRIEHVTRYRYDAPVRVGLSRLRLRPRTGATQTVEEWDVAVEGGRIGAAYSDHFGNAVALAETEAGVTEVVVTARGLVETRDAAGVLGAHEGSAPLWLFQRPTPRTDAGGALGPLLEGLPSDPLAQAHALSARVSDAIVWRTDETHAATTAAEALAHGYGVCQDQAHVFIAAARALGHPARYVSGYFHMPEREAQEASHAWAELQLPGLGWVGFDLANRVCPDDRHVRLAVGRDYADASPISGLRTGGADEAMEVALVVAAQQQ